MENINFEDIENINFEDYSVKNLIEYRNNKKDEIQLYQLLTEIKKRIIDYYTYYELPHPITISDYVEDTLINLGYKLDINDRYAVFGKQLV